MRAFSFVVLLALLPSVVCSAAEPMKLLTFVPSGEGIWKAKTWTKEILLTDTLKSKGAPEVWDGGLQIRDLKTGRLCNAKTDMIGEVYARKDGRVIISVTEVGAGDYFHFIDIDTCEEKYSHIHGYSQRPHIKKNVIVSGPICEQLGPEKAFCSSADVYALDADDRPVRLEKESMARTKQELGVGFKGGRLVENPRTKNAKLLPEAKDEGWFSSIKKWFSR